MDPFTERGLPRVRVQSHPQSARAPGRHSPTCLATVLGRWRLSLPTRVGQPQTVGLPCTTLPEFLWLTWDSWDQHRRCPSGNCVPPLPSRATPRRQDLVSRTTAVPGGPEPVALMALWERLGLKGGRRPQGPGLHCCRGHHTLPHPPPSTWRTPWSGCAGTTAPATCRLAVVSICLTPTHIPNGSPSEPLSLQTGPGILKPWWLFTTVSRIVTSLSGPPGWGFFLVHQHRQIVVLATGHGFIIRLHCLQGQPCNHLWVAIPSASQSLRWCSGDLTLTNIHASLVFQPSPPQPPVLPGQGLVQIFRTANRLEVPGGWIDGQVDG